MSDDVIKPAQSRERVWSLDDTKRMHREKKGRNQLIFHVDDVAEFLERDILRRDDSESLITRRGQEMADQGDAIAKILDKSTNIMEGQLVKFHRVCDEALDETKKRVSQLTDYNNRLSVAMLNLSKTLGDEKMVRALENADKIASALTLLDALEKKGSLQKIMAALK